MLSGLRPRGLDPRRVMADAGIPADCLHDPSARLPIAAYAALYNFVVRRLADEGFGLFGAPVRPGAFEFLCRGVVASHTLGEALERAARFLSLVLPQLRVSVTRERRTAFLEIAETSRLRIRANDPRRIFAFEWLLRLIHGLACWLVERGIALEEVDFPYARPRHAADYALVYTAVSRFDSPTLVARFDAPLLDLPVHRGDADLARFLEGAPGKISMLYRRDREMARAVRELLAASLGAAPSLAEAARALHVSTRTLHRRLREEGSSFRAIRDGLRREVALARLEKGRRSIADIAAELGYSEPSAFFRAFQGWTGSAPSTYRKRRGQSLA